MSDNKTDIYDINWKNTDAAIKTLQEVINSEEQQKIVPSSEINHNNSSNAQIPLNELYTSPENSNSHTKKMLAKFYILQEYPCQPHTSTQFVNYVRAGEEGNEILGGLVKNGPYKGQFLFTESKHFTGTVIIPEYIKINNNITTLYPEESITFFNGKIQDIHNTKPSRLKIHRAHLKEERNNSFQRDKALIHKFIVNDAKLHNQEIFFLYNPNKQTFTPKSSPKYIIYPDKQLIQTIENQQKSFIDKIPIINKLFKSYYKNRVNNASSPENLALYFRDAPEKFHIVLYAENKNGKPMKIDLRNLYIYNNYFYNKVEHAVHSSHHLHTQAIIENNISPLIPHISEPNSIIDTLDTETLHSDILKNPNDTINKIIIGLIPTFALIGIATATLTTQGIFLPVLVSALSLIVLTSKQLIPDSFKMLTEGTSFFTNRTHSLDNSENQPLSNNLEHTPQLIKDLDLKNKPSQENMSHFTKSVIESNKEKFNRSI